MVQGATSRLDCSVIMKRLGIGAVGSGAIGGAVGLVALVALVGCSTMGAPPVVSVEVVPIGKVDGGAPALASAARSSLEEKNRCDGRVTLSGRIRTGATCQLDEQVSHGPGRVRYPCNGDGPVELEIGSHRFTGSLLQGRVSLDLVTELDWDDSCHWETRQTVTGMLRGNTLRWAYSEKPIRGQGCFAACTASADLVVTPPGSPPPETEDEDPDP